MANNVNVTVKWNSGEINRIRRNFYQGIVAMAVAMEGKAKNNAPWLTGALVNSIRVDESMVSSGVVYVRAGGKSGGNFKHEVKYARRREFENNAHPSKKYYMTRAFNSVVKSDFKKYFKEIVK